MAITASIYSRLQFNFDYPEDNELTLSEGAVKSLNTMPKLIEDWQANDIGNNDVGGYFKNPVSNTVNSIISTSNTISILLDAQPGNINSVIGTTAEITGLFVNTLINLSNVANTNIASNSEGALFLDHTNRISGVVELGSVEDGVQRDTSSLPHFKSAIGIGRILTYITHQTDNIANSSVQSGSFTSLFIANTLITLSDDLLPYSNLIIGSLSYSGSGTELDPIVRTSNLTLSQVQTISNSSNSIFNTFKTRREHDVNFFVNSRNVLSDYGEVTYFAKTGETQDKLIRNFVGSDKLLSNTRIGLV